MPYIGNTPALDYISYAVQNFTVTAGTTVYTLDYSVSNENDIRLVLNNVIQRPGASYAYSATGTTLTLTSATNAGDTMYAVFIGRAVQTVVPPASSITNTMLAPSVITGQTAETSIADADTLLIYDDSATALRKMTKSNLFSGIANTPAFLATNSGSGSNQSVSNNTETKCTLASEVFDTNNCFDSTTNYRFTPTTAGKYFLTATLNIYGTNAAWQDYEFSIKKNGSTYLVYTVFYQSSGNQIEFNVNTISSFDDANGTTDYYECYVKYYYSSGAGSNVIDRSRHNINFGGFRLIGA